MGHKMAWLDKLLHKQRNVQRVCGQDRDQARDGAGGKTNTGEKSRPCIDTDVLTKARCSEDENKHAGDEKEPLVQTVFPFSLSYLRHLATCLTNFGLHFWTRSLHCFEYITRMK